PIVPSRASAALIRPCLSFSCLALPPRNAAEIQFAPKTSAAFTGAVTIGIDLISRPVGTGLVARSQIIASSCRVDAVSSGSSPISQSLTSAGFIAASLLQDMVSEQAHRTVEHHH